jgi:hypothetical protein
MRQIILAIGYRGGILLAVFLVVDGFLIWWINVTNSRTTSFVTAPVASGDVTLVTYALVGVAVITILAAIFFKFKPVPAC